MPALLNIGDFSRATFLSIKALRHYHDIGLPPPAWIDQDSGYRHYDVAQVPTAQVIRRLRDLGMGLEEIKTVVYASDVDTRNAAIIAHLLRMEAELAHTRTTVASLRALIEHGSAAITVEYRTVPETTTIAIRERVAGAEALTWRDQAFAELRAAVDTLSLRRVGSDSALYSSELLEDEHGEVVAFIPVADPIQAVGRARSWLQPATEYAVATHEGAFDDLDQTFGALGTAVAQRAICVQGPIRENYLIGALDTPDETKHRTEMCWPVFQVHQPTEPPQDPKLRI